MARQVIPVSQDTQWRLNRLERHVIGTEEQNWQDGLVVWRANLDHKFKQVRRLIHLWGGALLMAFLASGIIDQRAAKVIGAFVGGFTGH